MDKALIFGVFDFVSFHVCKTLLDQGIEVTGIPYLDAVETFIEEKRLEVGRNANFTENTFSSWAENRSWDGTKTTVILSFYDLFMQFHETLFQKKTITTPILQFIEQNKHKVDLISIFLPLQILTRSNDRDYVIFKDILEQMNELTEQIQLFYLPTIYGEWQPSTYLFQQAILKKMNRNIEYRASRENTTDALYIGDAVELLFEKMESKKPGSFLLESGLTEQWEKCAKYLGVEDPVTSKKEVIPPDYKISRVVVKKVTSISESLHAQMEHLQQIYLRR